MFNLINNQKNTKSQFQVLKTEFQTNHLAGTLLAGVLTKEIYEPPSMLETQLCSRPQPPNLRYGFLIYFFLFHVHCFFLVTVYDGYV